MATGGTAVDEYTDYSCSTSIERLARDVETLLRTWHVYGGSDRHVSISSQKALLNQTTATASAVHLIRSDQLVWNISYHLQDGRRMSCQMDLDLALWDGPSRDHETPTTTSKSLPYSLRRPACLSEMPTDLFADFSNLFGIGQHISLTPINVELPEQVREHLSSNILTRHKTDTTAVPVLASILSGWLQTALNIAATASHCCIPVFGIWGHYQPPQQQQSRQQGLNQNYSVVPPWVEASQKLTLSQPPSRYQRRRRQHTVPKNEQYVPPLLTGYLFAEDSTATFVCSVLPFYKKGAPPSKDPERRLSSWGSLLLRHCPDTSVALWGARHVFVWSRPERKQRSVFSVSTEVDPHEWRKTLVPPISAIDLTPESQVESYRQDCQRFALSLLERASGAWIEDPMWGPPEDPVASIHATVTWSGHADENDQVQPLLSLPFKSRSRRMSKADRDEMEDAIEGMVLDPCRPTRFAVQTRYDPEMAQASLAATQRCVLAALIRTTTLPTETLMSHLIEASVVDRWDSEAGNVIASSLADFVNASMATHSLVAAMDWTHAAEDMIDQGQAEAIVRRVLDGSASLGFPSPPSSMSGSECASYDDPLSRPLLAAAPPGRLLSLLFVQMARVRSPSSIALVWTVFVEELRRRWENRESLPNMKHVLGLDPPAETLHVKRCISTSRDKKASLSALLETEPDPDDFHCLIGQKLQVFNLCLESVIAADHRDVEHLEKRPRINDKDKTHSDEQQTALYLGSTLSEIAGNKLQISTEGDGADDDFFDADDGDGHGLLSAPKVHLLPTKMTPNSMPRKGARCRVHGLSLVAAGDQLYAPYLQRSYPLTNDVVAERRLMLAQQEGRSANTALQQRLEIAHRLLNAKLASDMSAFKAANPGSVLQDFITWYGNPVDPLQDYESSQMVDDIHLGVAKPEGAPTKEDRQSSAKYALKETRDLWARTWDDAIPLPASDQVPLFDATNTVGMALDYLETMHPGSLLCQVAAVNLGMAYFALMVSADGALKVDSVKAALESLRDKVESALRLLSLDATTGIGAPKEADPTAFPSFVVSIDAISSCERACTALSRAEILVSRATSLLHKLPNQYDLVERIMKNADGAPVELKSDECREAVLRAVQLQQERTSKQKTPDLNPRPAIRDYVFRNTDDLNPCQLCIRHEDEKTQANAAGVTALFVALTKYTKH